MSWGAIAVTLAASSLGVSAYSAYQQKKALKNMPEMPQLPDKEDAQGTTLESLRRKRRAASRTRGIFTSPLGVQSQANIARRTLLGG